MISPSSKFILRRLSAFVLCFVILMMGCQTRPVRQVNLERQLQMAVDRGDTAMVQQLLARGVDPNPKSVDSLAPLLLAAEQGYVEIVKDLLDHGVNPNVSSTKGNFTPLIRASVQGHDAIVQLLLESGANVNFRSDVGGTALMWASLRKRHKVMQVLLEAGALVNARGNHGETALSFAVNNHDVIAADLLLNHMADPFLGDFNGKSPANIAKETGQQEILKLIEKQHRQRK